MKTKLMTALVKTMLCVAVAFSSLPVIAQDRPTDNMQILREKVRADKKLVVAVNMDLTESEAKGFWPVYESYQKDLEIINQRLAKLISDYAQEYNNKTLSDEKAKKLTDEMLAIEEAEVTLRKSYAPKLGKILPARKVVRYLQIENKIRTIVKYELAAKVPLAP